MKRILGREGECPDFYKLREEFTNRFGASDGANTFHVLQKMCPKYCMRCQQVGLKGAMEAITSSRPVVATFRITDPERKRFGNFFRRNPKGIITLQKSIARSDWSISLPFARGCRPRN